MSESRAASVERTIWHDGHFVAWRDATVHVLAQSLQRGSLAFDYLSVYETARGTCGVSPARPCRTPGDDMPHRRASAGLPRRDAWSRPRRKRCVAMAAPSRSRSARSSRRSRSNSCRRTNASRCSSPRTTAVPTSLPTTPGDYRRRDVLSLKIEREKSARRQDILPPHAKVAGNYTAAMTAKWRARREGLRRRRPPR